MSYSGGDSLARAYSRARPNNRELHGIPQIDESPLLDRHLLRIQECISNEGLKSLLWVSGIHTSEIAAHLLDTITGKVEVDTCDVDDFCIVAKPGETQLVEAFSSRYGCSLRRMQEVYDDSFVIVNETAVLDVTPVANDDGAPEFIDDPTVVSLYIGLFNMLKNRSTPV